MARQDGYGYLRGKLNSIHFFKRDGSYWAGALPGPSREKVKKSPNYIRTRENNEEFKYGVYMSQHIRKAFQLKTLKIAHTAVNARLIGKIVNNVRTDETNERGKRKLNLNTLANWLTGFEFSYYKNFSNVFTLPVTYTRVDNKNFTVNIPTHNPGVHVLEPTLATHYKFVVTIAYDKPNGSTEYAHEAQTQETSYLSVAGSKTAIILNFTFPAELENRYYLLAVGIFFYEQNAETLEFYPMNLEKNDAMKLVGVELL